MARADGKTQKIRDSLKSKGRPMNLDEIRSALEMRLRQIISKQKLYTLLSVMINTGELGSVGRGDDYRFYWFRKPQ